MAIGLLFALSAGVIDISFGLTVAVMALAGGEVALAGRGRDRICVLRRGVQTTVYDVRAVNKNKVVTTITDVD